MLWFLVMNRNWIIFFVYLAVPSLERLREKKWICLPSGKTKKNPSTLLWWTLCHPSTNTHTYSALLLQPPLHPASNSYPFFSNTHLSKPDESAIVMSCCDADWLHSLLNNSSICTFHINWAENPSFAPDVTQMWSFFFFISVKWSNLGNTG